MALPIAPRLAARADMGMRRLSIGIAGAGVAGLAAGALLARAGHRVVAFDKLTAPAPVGSGLILQPVGLHVLGELGRRAAIEALGARIARLYGRANGKVVLDVRYEALGAGCCGLAVHRAALFSVLYDAAVGAGVEINADREVVAAADGALTFADGKRAGPFDLVIDALGMRSPVSRPSPPLVYGALWANVAWDEAFARDALEQRYERARKMAGVLPIGRRAPGARVEAAYFWSLRGRDHAAWRAAPLAAWKDEARALWPQTAPLLDQLSSHDDLVFARYAHRTLRTPVAPGLAHVGDAYHCASPQLGQGANMALLDALALARALERQDDLAVALAEYARMRALHVALYQLASWAFTPAYQGDGAIYPWVRDHIVAPLAQIWPAPQVLAALVAGAVGWPLGTIGVRSGRRRMNAPLSNAPARRSEMA